MSRDPFPSTELYADTYFLAERLGVGGTGVVYKASHAALQQERAIKILHPRRGASSQATLRQLRLEASVFGKLGGNPSIVMPLDIGFDVSSQTHFLAMELLRGSDLFRWVNAEGPLPVRKALVVLRQVAAALDAAHGYVDENGSSTPIVHRDLTPSNLFLIEPHSDSPQAKVLDFGLAAVLDRTSAARQGRSGTAFFRSYEQANGLELAPQTDVWALGLLVYFALTGRMYWRERTAKGLLDEITVRQIDVPSERLREQLPDARLPSGFDAWFLRCLDRVAERRFTTAGEAVEELAGCLQGSGVDVEQPLLGTRAAARLEPSQSRARTVVPTELEGEDALAQPYFGQTTSPSPSPALALAEQLHPLLRNVLRVSDDLMTGTGHYLAFPPEGEQMWMRQLDGVTHHVTQYNEARDLLRRELAFHEGLLRRVHREAPPSLYAAGRDALAAALTFNECFTLPEAEPNDDVLRAFARECSYWQAERVLLHAQLEVGRIRVRTLEREIESAAEDLMIGHVEQQEVALRGANLLGNYASTTSQLAATIRQWAAEPRTSPQELSKRAWAMAPRIEAMNEAYVSLDGAFALHVALARSQVPLHRRVSNALAAVHDFQWYEFRPLLNAPLVQVIRFLCSGSVGDAAAWLSDDLPRWHRLARALDRASARFAIH